MIFKVQFHHTRLNVRLRTTGADHYNQRLTMRQGLLLKVKSDSPRYFSVRHIGFRPYGDAIPQSMNVTSAALPATGIRNQNSPCHRRFSTRLALDISACLHPGCSFWFPGIRARGFPPRCSQPGSSGFSMVLTPVIVPTHYIWAGQFPINLPQSYAQHRLKP